MSVQRTAAALVLAALSVSGCKARVSEAKASPAADAAVHVETAPVESRTVPVTLKLTGALGANRSSEVAADVAGKVAATHVERGSVVKKGALLARLDGASAALAAAQARADSEGARADALLAADELARVQQLHAKGAVAEVELTRAKARKEAADQRVAAASARAALQAKTASDVFIRAPFDGLVADRWVDEGEYVRPDTRVVTLIDVDTLRLKLFVPESAALSVREGQDVAFAVASEPGATFSARVRFIGPEVRSASRELVVEAVYENRERRLRPGMFATARLQLGERKALVVPASALRKQGSGLRAFVVANGRIEARAVQTADGVGDEVVVTGGLAEGERIVTRATDELRDGLRAE